MADSRDERRTGGVRFGLGDALVVLCLVGLVTVAWLPHGTGERQGGREAEAVRSLQRLAVALDATGLGEALSEALAASREIDELEVRLDHEPELRGEQTLWNDGPMRYRLRYDPLPDDARDVELPLLVVRPKYHPEDAFWLRPGGEGLLGEGAGDAPGIAAARTRAAALLKILATPNGAFERLATALRMLRGRGARAPALESRYAYSIGFVPRGKATAAEVEVELYARPRTQADDGHAAFRWTRGRGVQQSRNLVLRYDEDRAPSPLAAVFRPGSNYDGAHGYTGLDGNQWLPVVQEVDRVAYRDFLASREILLASDFAQRCVAFEQALLGFLDRDPETVLRIEVEALLDVDPRASFHSLTTVSTAPGAIWHLGVAGGDADALLWTRGADTPATATPPPEPTAELSVEFARLRAAARETSLALGWGGSTLTWTQPGTRRRFAVRFTSANDPAKQSTYTPKRLYSWPSQQPGSSADSRLVFGLDPAGVPRLVLRDLQSYGTLVEDLPHLQVWHRPDAAASLPADSSGELGWHPYVGRDGQLWASVPRQFDSGL